MFYRKFRMKTWLRVSSISGKITEWNCFINNFLKFLHEFLLTDLSLIVGISTFQEMFNFMLWNEPLLRGNCVERRQLASGSIPCPVPANRKITFCIFTVFYNNSNLIVISKFQNGRGKKPALCKFSNIHVGNLLPTCHEETTTFWRVESFL